MRAWGQYTTLLAAPVLLAGCEMMNPPEPYIPSMRYAGAAGVQRGGTLGRESNVDGRARLHMVDGDIRPGERQPHLRTLRYDPDISGTNVDLTAPRRDDVVVHHSREQLPRAYAGPLALGDPGVSSSLWRESRSGNDVFRDNRAWQPMDLITIVVTERSQGTHDAETETRSTSQVLAAIENFLGFEDQTQEWDHVPTLSSLVNASTRNDYRGEGETTRQATLTARISAVVAEVLPSGLLRIEGEKIIAVNSEEQVMVISGLVRTQDINSNNEIDSSKIAQVRIDYYGKGIVGEAQVGGWLGRLMRLVWPF